MNINYKLLNVKLSQIIFISGFILCFNNNISIAQTYDIILGRPTDKSITISILFDKECEFYFEYSKQSNKYTHSSQTFTNKLNTPDEIDLINLEADTRYYYKLNYRIKGTQTYIKSSEFYFQTQRSPGKSFKFLVEADEHLYDKKGVKSMYLITLQNQAKDSADFMLSLGDIFGDDHTPTTTKSADMDALHKDYRQFLGTACQNMPFYVCLGNHEGETGYYLKQNGTDNIAYYGTIWRKFYYPNPYPNEFYTGNKTLEPNGIGTPENYYAWTWGDALFVVLDVYRDCDINDKPQNWDWTLGKTQYDWFKNALETSSAKYKFVFSHHNRGQGRGGIVPAKGFEWGGLDNTKDKFSTFRKGWDLPIHQLMVKNGVTVFFQGHDHLYAKEEMDGLVYQEVPMPSDSTYEIGMLANADAYTDVTKGGTGHIRVNVEPKGVTVDFVRAYLPKDTLDGIRKNGEIAYSYTVGKSQSDVEYDEKIKENNFSITHNKTSDILEFQASNTSLNNRLIELVDVQGNFIESKILEKGYISTDINSSDLNSGIYVARLINDKISNSSKVIIIK